MGFLAKIVKSIVIDPRKIDVNLSHRFSANDKWQSEKIYVDAPPSHRERDVCYATLILVQLRITDWRDVHSVFLFCIMFVVTQKGGLL